jgi:1-acyl-sn-glycerol-3-phosphate acyltransferase
VGNHVRNLCRPFTLEGADNLEGLQNPLVVIANHTSHFDTAIVLHVLPGHIYGRTAIAAAADRMYRERWKGMYNSLRYNSFPITRGGGRKALAYSQWLIDRGWSLLMFPEGRRSRTGELLPFHIGPAILAISQNAPVLPIHITGSRDILPAGTRRASPAAVTARVGPLLRFPQGTAIDACKQQMEDAVRTLAG